LIGGSVRTRAFVAFGVVFVAMLAVVGSQPIRSPWWTYADADASYTATGIDLFAGEHSFFLDHPGMPIQDLMAMTTEARSMVVGAVAIGVYSLFLTWTLLRNVADTLRLTCGALMVWFVVALGLWWLLLR